MVDCRDLVNDLCDLTDGLTNWECEFVSNMFEWEGEYTDAQKAKIEAIADRVL